MDDEDDVALTAWDLGLIWLQRQLWLSTALLVVGLIVLLIDRWWGVLILGISSSVGGLIPMITGSYRGITAPLRGWRARVRGALGVAIGAVVIAMAMGRL